jgi:hypothetical protein
MAARVITVAIVKFVHVTESTVIRLEEGGRQLEGCQFRSGKQ